MNVPCGGGEPVVELAKRLIPIQVAGQFFSERPQSFFGEVVPHVRSSQPSKTASKARADFSEKKRPFGHRTAFAGTLRRRTHPRKSLVGRTYRACDIGSWSQSRYCP